MPHTSASHRFRHHATQDLRDRAPDRPYAIPRQMEDEIERRIELEAGMARRTRRLTGRKSERIRPEDTVRPGSRMLPASVCPEAIPATAGIDRAF